MPEPRRSDELVRAYLMAWWSARPEFLAAHCGGRGLAVGCPVCGKRWGK